RNLRGNSLQRRVEDQREAHQRAVKVEMRGRLGADDIGDAVERAHKARQLFLTGEDDTAAALGDERDVAGELDRVADSLLALEEDGAAMQVIAVPAGVWVVNEMRCFGE